MLILTQEFPSLIQLAKYLENVSEVQTELSQDIFWPNVLIIQDKILAS